MLYLNIELERWN